MERVNDSSLVHVKLTQGWPKLLGRDDFAPGAIAISRQHLVMVYDGVNLDVTRLSLNPVTLHPGGGGGERGGGGEPVEIERYSQRRMSPKDVIEISPGISYRVSHAVVTEVDSPPVAFIPPAPHPPPPPWGEDSRHHIPQLVSQGVESQMLEEPLSVVKWKVQERGLQQEKRHLIMPPPPPQQPPQPQQQSRPQNNKDGRRRCGTCDACTDTSRRRPCIVLSERMKKAMAATTRASNQHRRESRSVRGSADEDDEEEAMEHEVEENTLELDAVAAATAELTAAGGAAALSRVSVHFEDTVTAMEAREMQLEVVAQMRLLKQRLLGGPRRLLPPATVDDEDYDDEDGGGDGWPPRHATFSAAVADAALLWAEAVAAAAGETKEETAVYSDPVNDQEELGKRDGEGDDEKLEEDDILAEEEAEFEAMLAAKAVATGANAGATPGPANTDATLGDDSPPELFLTPMYNNGEGDDDDMKDESEVGSEEGPDVTKHIARWCSG